MQSLTKMSLRDLYNEDYLAWHEVTLKQIIVHLLLIEYWDSEKINHRHWASEITNFRDELENDMTTNLRKHLEKEIGNLYQKSVKYVVIKTGLNKNIFPNQCPYTLEQLLNENWFPQNIDLINYYLGFAE